MLLLKCQTSIYLYVLVTLSAVSLFIMCASGRIAQTASKYKISRAPNTNVKDGLKQCAAKGNELTRYAVMDTSGRCETVGAEKNIDITETAIFLHKESFQLMFDPEVMYACIDIWANGNLFQRHIRDLSRLFQR